MEYIQQVKNNTFCLNGAECIPVYFLDDNNVILLDSGHGSYDKDLIKSEIIDRGINIKAVICSHTHVDHTGNNQMLQKEYGAEIISNYIEDALAATSTTLASLYKILSPYDMEEYFPNMPCKADRIFSPQDTSVTVQNQVFKLFYLPGHTAGHTAIETPDGVLYLGDAIVSDDFLEQSKLLTMMNWEEDAGSKKKLYTMKHSHYIFAHKGVSNDIRETIRHNEEKKENTEEFIITVLSGREFWNTSEIEQALWDAFGMHTGNYIKQTIYRRNLMNCIDYLIYKSRISREIIRGTGVYSVIR